MPVRTASRRRQRRFAVAQGRAWVEFEFPARNGRRFTLPLIDMSASGVSFSVNRSELAGIEIGSALSRAAVCIGDCRIEGDLVVMHLTPETGPTATCGALLYPQEDGDLVKLKSLIAGMGAMDED